jgi:hypothetical protein
VALYIPHADPSILSWNVPKLGPVQPNTYSSWPVKVKEAAALEEEV